LQFNIQHAKVILIKFLVKVPPIEKDAEAMLPIVFKMLLFTDKEISELQIERAKYNDPKNQKKKGGLFGRKP